MKNKILILIISLFSVYSCSQTKSENFENDIKNSLTSFIINMKEKKINSAVEHIYPKYFEVISKEQMAQILNYTYNNPAIITEIQNYNIDKVEKPEKIESEYYSIVNYSFKMKLKIDWAKFSNSEQVKSQMQNSLFKKFGENNVEYSSNEDYYIIYAKMKSCAISSNQKDWKFIVLEPQYKSQLKNILPERILNKF